MVQGAVEGFLKKGLVEAIGYDQSEGEQGRLNTYLCIIPAKER